MRRLADRFGTSAACCTSLAGLEDLLREAVSNLGFRYFAILHHASLRRPGPFIRIDNYPPAWVAELIQTGLAQDDPIHAASRRASAGFVWRDIDRLVTLTPTQEAVLRRSRAFGLGEGMTVPVNVPGEPSGSCSFAVCDGHEIPRERLHCAELIGARAFEAARRIGGLPDQAVRPHLSRREAECLRLVAAGKTDWEIAIILGIGVETVHQYLKRARSAYAVVTRAQLVAVALRDDWLTFEDARDCRR